MTPSTDSPPQVAPSPWRWWVCLLLMLATVINYMDRMALNQMARRIKLYFDLNNQEYGYLESAFSVAFAIGAVSTGWLVDRVSVRWVYPVMVLGWSAAGVLTGFASGFWMLLGCRFALGLFEAGNWPCGMKTTRAVLRREERSLGNSLFQSGTALGAVVAPLVVLALLRSADPGEPVRNAIVSVTGGTFAAVADAPTDTWKYPFRVIGSLGVVWIALWFLTVPRAMLRPAEESVAGAGLVHFRDVLRDARFWILFAMSIGINVTWHGYRTWLPLYLQEQRGFSEKEMSQFTTLYYVVADIGSWTVGGVTLVLCRRGTAVHRSRVLAYGFCAACTLATVAVPFLPNGVPLQLGLLVVAFGAMGLFPTYFALSQELSAAHQGKVSGSLGMCAHGALALAYPVEGYLTDLTKSYEPVLGAIGVAPLVAFVLLLWLWPPGRGAEGA
ncbi:MFS transporter [Gemmata sp.]|uniref:MFS transporter n=1 Tax=Gemmata sp. TaxID=1914242 RepID=UPI003F71779C